MKFQLRNHIIIVKWVRGTVQAVAALESAENVLCVCSGCWFVSLCEFVLAGLCMRINSFIAKCSKITIIPLIILFIRGQLFPGTAVFFLLLRCVVTLNSLYRSILTHLVSTLWREYFPILYFYIMYLMYVFITTTNFHIKCSSGECYRARFHLFCTFAQYLYVVLLFQHTFTSHLDEEKQNVIIKKNQQCKH